MKSLHRREFLRATGVAGLMAVFIPWAAQGQAPEDHALRNAGSGLKPNIVFILADDLSSHSIGAYGGTLYRSAPPGRPEPLVEKPVTTPGLDRMAEEGMRFENVLAAPVCSPTRGMFLTGKYNFRIGLTDVVGRGGAEPELDVARHVTLPQLLKASGYSTAMAGKWHLSKKSRGPRMTPSLEDNPSAHITRAGFDRQFQHPNGECLKHYRDPNHPGAYTADWIQAWVLKFLDEQKDATQPFFLYYAHPMPHSPWGPTPDSPETYDDPGHKGVLYFGDHVTYLDKHVGEVLDKVRELGISEDTLVVFSGDNGSEGPFTVMDDGSYSRGGKFNFGQSARVPLIAWWPGVIEPGSLRDDPIDFSDMMPTLLDVAGVSLPADADIDGVSFRNAMLGKPGSARDWILSYRLGNYVVRDRQYGLREDGKLYDLTKEGRHADHGISASAMTPDIRAAYDRFVSVVSKYELPVDADKKKLRF